MRYLRSSPNLPVMTISRLPRLTRPIATSPSISATNAGLDGLRASKSSVTRGRPPVISPAFELVRLILTTISPGLISSPSLIMMWAPTGNEYVRRMIGLPSSSTCSGSRISASGTNVRSFDSITIRSSRPVSPSISAAYVTPATTPLKRILPATSQTMTALNGSHSAMISPLCTSWPLSTKSFEP